MADQARKVLITDTTFRDAHQSLLATRMQAHDMLGIAEQMDKVGFHSMEVWGGATFDSAMRFLNEDPWIRLREFRKAMPNTKLQMLLRGQNLVGYRHYPDDVVEEFVKKAIYNGIDIIRIFDALNDIRNIRKALEVTVKEGGNAQGTISYTTSPVHNLEYYVRVSKQLEEMGANSICIKDMAGIITPYDTYDLVKALKSELKIPVQLHCHYTSGMASMAYLKAIEAGVDVIDTAISSLALATSQPATETMVATLEGTAYDTGLKLEDLTPVADYFKDVRKKYKEFDVADPSVDTNVLLYQIPGGMISNFNSQLIGFNALDRLPEVLAEVPRVRADFGYPPLVTPSSQIVGSQAVFNVLLGADYAKPTRESKDYMRGLYGNPPGKINEEARKKIIGDEQPVDGRPADYIEPMLEKAKEEIKFFIEQEEDVLSYCLFPQVAEKFFKDRMAKKGIDVDLMKQGEGSYPV